MARAMVRVRIRARALARIRGRARARANARVRVRARAGVGVGVRVSHLLLGHDGLLAHALEELVSLLLLGLDHDGLLGEGHLVRVRVIRVGVRVRVG